MAKEAGRPSLIHIAVILSSDGHPSRLYLRRENGERYHWYTDSGERTGVEASLPSLAIESATKHWKLNDFRLIRCGFRFVLPGRDEIGTPAFFDQMVASYSSSSGVYFDEEVGHPCIVHSASAEALKLWHELEADPHFSL